MKTVKSETTDAPKKDEEVFDDINLSSSLESCPLVSSTPLASQELIETVDVPVEPRQLDSSLERVGPVNLGAPVEDKTIHNTDSIISYLVELLPENLEKPSPVNIINDEANITDLDRRTQIPA